MTDPPSDAPGETLPHASAPARHLSTNTYPRCGHGRGRRTSKAVSARRLCRSGTNATGPWTQIDDVGHGYVARGCPRSEEHTSELQSRLHLVCRLLLEKKKTRSIVVSA